jgi:hypothetical protein
MDTLAGQLPGDPTNLCMLCTECFLMFKHWFCWKFQYKKMYIYLYSHNPIYNGIEKYTRTLLCNIYLFIYLCLFFLLLYKCVLQSSSVLLFVHFVFVYVICVFFYTIINWIMRIKIYIHFFVLELSTKSVFKH